MNFAPINSYESIRIVRTWIRLYYVAGKNSFWYREMSHLSAYKNHYLRFFCIQVMEEYLPKESLVEYKAMFSMFDEDSTGLIKIEVSVESLHCRQKGRVFTKFTLFTYDYLWWITRMSWEFSIWSGKVHRFPLFRTFWMISSDPIPEEYLQNLLTSRSLSQSFQFLSRYLLLFIVHRLLNMLFRAILRLDSNADRTK